MIPSSSDSPGMNDPSVDKGLDVGRLLSFPTTGSGSASVRISAGSGGFGDALPRDDVGLSKVNQNQQGENVIRRCVTFEKMGREWLL